MNIYLSVPLLLIVLDVELIVRIYKVYFGSTNIDGQCDSLVQKKDCVYIKYLDSNKASFPV